MSEKVFPMLPFGLNPGAIRFPENTKAFNAVVTCHNCTAIGVGKIYLERMSSGVLLPVADSGGLEETIRTHHDMSRDGNDYEDGPCNTFTIELPAIGLLGIVHAASLGCSGIEA
ncbi:MAG: hypothetical protein NTV98_00140 [Candidatus Roizmanbacteria bacterium]|nr:hypothetical protein [Candidatus Roizmanbacteria bacterium]